MMRFWQQAKQALKTADSVFKDGDYNATANRAYYAMFYGARTALEELKSVDTSETKSHSGLIRLFSLHFIKGSELDKQFSFYLSQGEYYRNQADYQDGFLDEESAEQSLKAAHLFINALERMLNEQKPS